MKHRIGAVIAGIGAGALNGLLGAGGGMVLAPLLGSLTDLEENKIFQEQPKEVSAHFEPPDRYECLHQGL